MADIISTNGKKITAIDIGSRIVLRGDENSPEMIVVSGIVDQQGVQRGWACGWFSPDATELDGKQRSTWNMIQLATEAIELVIEPTIQ